MSRPTSVATRSPVPSRAKTFASAPAANAVRPTPHADDGHEIAQGSTRPILVVGSDPEFAKTLVEQFANDGYRAEYAISAEHARTRARGCRPRLLVLGGLERSRAALELLEEIRRTACGNLPQWSPGLPVVVIGAGDSQLEVLRAFEAGADDFVARPARYLELRARVRALLRRAESDNVSGEGLTVGPLEIDTASHTVSVNRLPVRLRRLEFELLVHLASDPERVFAKQELLRAVWGYRSTGSTRTVDSHASRLRRKLEQQGGHWIVNEWGVGYRLH